MTHDDFHNAIAPYLAGGLSDGERAAFAAHAAGCPACAAALEQGEAADRELADLFADARPDAALEDRLVAGFRHAGRPPAVLHPMVRRAAVGVAAAILLGGVGFTVTQAEQGGSRLVAYLDRTTGFRLDDAAASRIKSASNLRQIGQSVPSDRSGITPPAQMAERFAAEATNGRGAAQAAGGTRADRFWAEGQPGGGAAGARGVETESREFAAPADKRQVLSSSETLDRIVNATGNAAATLSRSDAEASLEAGVTRERTETRRFKAPAGGTQADATMLGVKAAEDAPKESAVAGKPLTFHDYYAVDPAAGQAPAAGVSVATGAEGKFKPDEMLAYRAKQAGGQAEEKLGDGGAGGRYGFGGPGGSGGAPAPPAAQGQPNEPGKDLKAPADAQVQDHDLPSLQKATGSASGPVDAIKQLSDGERALDRRLGEGWEKRGERSEGRAPAGAGDAATPAGKPADFVDAPDLSLKGAEGKQDTAGLFAGEAGDKAAAAEAGLAEGEQRAANGEAKPQSGAGGPQPAGAPAAAADDDAPGQAQAGQQRQADELARQANRKVIRNGEMSFEVDGFDSAVVQINKIAAEEGGFVATTESEKLPNGKVKGSVIVRVPPERLDTLVLKLRGLGDLKNSRIAATDITKQFTDLEAQLRAAKTMEERLLEIIKTGKGEVKDLLEAEKQLGTWRERIETLEGEIRYYANLVSLSTLTVTLVERDIRTSALLSESEQINMGLEADDVEEARAAALKAIEEVKGRVVESDLKTHDAGQYSATIVADVSPDAAGKVTDRLKQVGRVARLEVQRRRATAEGTAPAPGARVERSDTRLQLSIYNLANVAPRNTTTLHLAAEDVEKAYRAVLEQVGSAGGRVVNSQLTKPTPEQTTGTVTFEAPAGAADVLLGAVRAAGEVMRLESTTNPDTQNSTDAKRGFSVQVQSLATVPPRESTTLRLAARDVPAAFEALRDAVRGANGRVLTSQLAEQDRTNVTGQLDFEVRRDDLAAVDAALAAAGVVLSRNVSRSADAQNTVDSKVMLQVALVDERTVPPRETVTLNLAVNDVAARYEALFEALRGDALGAGGAARVLVSTINQQDPNNTTAQVEFDVRRESRAAVDKALADAGAVYGRTVSRPAEGQVMLDDKVRLAVTLNDVDNLAPRETTTLGIEAADVTGVTRTVEATALSLGGRTVDSDWGQDPGGRMVGRVVVDVPLARAGDLLQAAQREGRVLTVQRQQDPSAPEGSFARARLALTVATEDPIVQRDRGLGSSVRAGLSTSVHWLLRSVTWIVVGLCLVAPWALIGWVVWRIVRGRRKHRDAGGPGSATPPLAPPPPSSPGGPPAGGPVVSPAA